MKYAVLVGINNYQDGNNLMGCCNDVDNMQLFLLERGYDFPNITILKNKKATKKAIVEALEAGVAELEAEDILTFHFSGHGSQVADTSGDEADRKDELLCPHDMNWDGTYITDDELSEIFSHVPHGCCAEIILDCCHSGTGARQFSMTKNIPSPANSVKAPCKQIKDAFRSARGLTVVWAGSADSQTSADAFIAGSWQGAFTYTWLKTVKKYPKTSRQEILDEVKYQLNANNFSQVPQLEVATGGKR